MLSDHDIPLFTPRSVDYVAGTVPATPGHEEHVVVIGILYYVCVFPSGRVLHMN